MCYQMISYLLAVLFISLASSPAIQAAFREATGASDDKNILFSVACIAIFSIFYYILCQSCTCHLEADQEAKKDQKINEPFYFEVTPNRTLLRNIPDYAIYKGGPGVGFSFDAVGSGMCSFGECRTEGLIKGCPDAKVYGEGNPANYM